MANTKVTSRVLANDAVLTANIADDQVTTAKIADDVALGGNPTTTTQTAGNNTTRIATTAFVTTAVANIVDSAPSALDTLNELAAALGDDANFSTTITNSIATKAPLASPTFTGDVDIDATDDLRLRFLNGGTFKGGIQVPTSTGDMISGSAVDDLAIRSQGNILFSSGGNIEHMRIQSGNVGIGDDSPSRRLTVKSAGANATQISLVDNDSTNEVFAVGQQSDGDGFLTVNQDDGTTKVLFDASGDSYIAGGSLHIGSTDSISSSSEIFSVYSASTGHTKLVNNSDSYGTVYMHNESTTANTFQPSIVIQKGGGNRGNIGVRHSDSVLGIQGQGGISLRTASTSLQASTERLNIGSDGFVKFGGGNGFGSLHNTGQNVTSSFANYFDFSDLAVGGGQERGMYLVALSRNGGSVGSRLLAFVGVSTNSTVFVYEILASAVLSIQSNGSSLQVKHSSTGTQSIQGTAIPVAIDHN